MKDTQSHGIKTFALHGVFDISIILLRRTAINATATANAPNWAILIDRGRGGGR